jgi:hypothetical protein
VQLGQELVASEEVASALELAQAQGLKALAMGMMKRMLRILTQVLQYQILEHDVECFVVKFLVLMQLTQASAQAYQEP